MLVFFLIVGGLLYLASVYIKQKYGTLDIFVEEAKRKLSGDEEKESDSNEDPNFPPEPSNLVAPSPEDPDVEAQEEVPEPTQEQLSKWKELEEMCKPGGLRSLYTGFKVDEETGEFVPEYENIDCCYEQPWENEGECVDGQQKQVRGILNEDLCEVEPEKEQMLDCCSYGEWENDGECIDGVQKQKRQIFNPELCVDTTTTREIDCCSYGEWELDGECVDGKQNYKRTIINSGLCEDTSLEKTEPCCLPLEWVNVGDCKVTGMQMQQRAHINRDLCTGDDYEDVQEIACCYRSDWQNVGKCDYSRGKILQTRNIENSKICQAEGDAATQQSVDCCYIGPWVDEGLGDEETGIQKQGREIRNSETCPEGTENTQEIPGCKRTPWVPDPNWNSGRGCNADGENRMMRTITLMDKCRNPDPTSEENRITKIDKCCSKGEWKKAGPCVDGEQKVIRTILNKDLCDENDGDVDGIATEKNVPCCSLGDWKIDENQRDGDPDYDKTWLTKYCKPDGNMTFKRELFNRELCESDGKYELLSEELTKEEPCCYISAIPRQVGECKPLHKKVDEFGNMSSLKRLKTENKENPKMWVWGGENRRDLDRLAEYSDVWPLHSTKNPQLLSRLPVKSGVLEGHSGDVIRSGYDYMNFGNTNTHVATFRHVRKNTSLCDADTNKKPIDNDGTTIDSYLTKHIVEKDKDGRRPKANFRNLLKSNWLADEGDPGITRNGIYETSKCCKVGEWQPERNVNLTTGNLAFDNKIKRWTYGVINKNTRGADLRRYFVENKLACGPEGKAKLTRVIENPDVCRREVKHGIRDPDPDDFATEKEYDCCRATHDVVWTKDCKNSWGKGYKKMYNIDKCPQAINKIYQDLKPGGALAQLFTTEGAEALKKSLDTTQSSRALTWNSEIYGNQEESAKKTADSSYDYDGRAILCQRGNYSGNRFDKFWR